MRRAPGALLLVLLALGCARSEGPLRLVASPEEPAPRIAARLAELLADQAGLEVEVMSGGGSFAHLDALRRGEADLAIVANSVPYHPDLAAIAPLYLGVLHVLHRSPDSARTLAEVLRGRAVYAGPEGGIARRLLGWLTHAVRIEADAYRLVENPFEGVDVYFTVGGVISDLSLVSLEGYRLLDLDGVGGIPVEALTLKHPQLHPFVIPEGLYPELDHAATLTLAVPSLLVARGDLPSTTAFQVAKTVLEHNPELRDVSPLADRDLLDANAAERLSFPLHEGVRRYLAREQPSFIERYAEVIGLNLSGLIALMSAIVALRRWRAQSRKDRLDDYYARVLAVRQRLGETRDPDGIRALEEALRAVQSEAYALLIDEKIAANEAFVILQALVADVAAELDGARRAT